MTCSCDTRRIQLGKTLNRYICFINRKYLTLILDWFNCTGKFCYRHGNIQNTEAATGGVLKAFTNFKGNHPSQSLFLIKIAGLRPATVLKETLTQVFSVNFVNILRTRFLQATVSPNYVHAPWRLHLSGVEIPGDRWTMLCWRRFFPLPSPFIATLV